MVCTMENQVKVEKFEGGAIDADGMHLDLDCETKTLRIQTNSEVSQQIKNQTALRWHLPALGPRTANKFLKELVPFAQRICDGYTRKSKISQYYGHFSEDAMNTITEIGDICNHQFGSEFVEGA